MNLGDIKNKIYDITKTNSTSYPAANLLIDLNVAYNRITSLITQSDGRWQWDDSNQPTTDQGGGIGGQPNGTCALVAGQQDYSFPVNYLQIERIEVKPNGGTFFYKLFPRDVEDPMWGSPVLGVDTLSQAAPYYYDLVGTSAFLYPIPNYSQAASLKFYFKRAQVDFTPGDLSTGTLVPGFASLFHDLLCYLVAYDYAVVNIPALINSLAPIVQKKEADLKEYYSHRNLDDGPRLSMQSIRFR